MKKQPGKKKQSGFIQLISMIQLISWTAFETPSTRTFLILQLLSISVTFWNQQSARFELVSQALFFYSLQGYICHFCVQRHDAFEENLSECVLPYPHLSVQCAFPLSVMAGFSHYLGLWRSRTTCCTNWLVSSIPQPSQLQLTASLRLAYPVLEKQFHRPWPWLQRSRLKTRLKSRYRWRLSTSGSLQIRCSADRTFVRTISRTWVSEIKDRREQQKFKQACDN